MWCFLHVLCYMWLYPLVLILILLGRMQNAQQWLLICKNIPCLYPRTTFDHWFPNWLNVDWPLQANLWHLCPIVLIRLLFPGLLRWHFKVKASATCFKLFSSHHVSYYAHIQSSTMGESLGCAMMCTMVPSFFFKIFCWTRSLLLLASFL